MVGDVFHVLDKPRAVLFGGKKQAVRLRMGVAYSTQDNSAKGGKIERLYVLPAAILGVELQHGAAALTVVSLLQQTPTIA
jgi:hypothetical protein